MKPWMVVIVIFFQKIPALATPEVMIRSKDSDPLEFQKILDSRQAESYVDFFSKEDSSPQTPHPVWDGSFEELQRFQQELETHPFHKKDLEIYVSILLRLMELKPNLHNSLQKRIESLLILYPHLQTIFFEPWSQINRLREPTRKLDAQEVKEAFHVLHSRPDLMDAVILIDGTRLTEASLSHFLDRPAQWVLVSNTHEPFVSFGTRSQFMAGLQYLKEFKVGACNKPDLESSPWLKASISIFYGKNCLVKAVIDEQQEVHLQMEKKQNTNWILPLTALGAGLLWSQLHDKRVTIYTPSFHF